MSDDLGVVQEFLTRYRAGQFSGEDLAAFYAEMALRRNSLVGDLVFWQAVYDELLGSGAVVVPPLPDRITDRQRKSFRKYNFMLLYIPALAEDQCPSSFVKLDWTRHVIEGVIERMPLSGQWIALEMIELPTPKEAPFVSDPFMEALGLKSRFGLPQECLGVVPFGRMSKTAGFPKEKTRLPSVEELNFVANLFLWLKTHREMRVPHICREDSYEWCGNTTTSGALIYGTTFYNGLAHTHILNRDCGFPHVGFRVLVEV